jgi:ferredoxin
MEWERISTAIGQHGLALRGGFHPTPQDGLPPLPGDRPAATVVLVGTVGGSMWPPFSMSLADDPGPDPLDRWTGRVLDRIAARFEAMPLYPFGGPPHWPFQRWARRADAVHASPLGVLIHPDYGLWHAYRGALTFDRRLELPPRDRGPSPCESCAGRPCLAACPVDAFGFAGYDVAACRDHIGGAVGRACLEIGCKARLACPVGREHAYEPAQAEFHMAAFLNTREKAS